MNKIQNYLEWSDRNSKKFYFILLLPITVLFEYIYMKKYWLIVLNELLTKDAITDWLNLQGFQLKKFFIYKKDLIEPTSYNGFSDVSVATKSIEAEFVNHLGDLIEEHCETDIEEHFTLDVKVFNLDGNRIYSVYLKFWRYDIYVDRLKKFKIISLIIGLGLITICLLLTLLHFTGII